MRILPLGRRESLIQRARKAIARRFRPPTSPMDFMEAVVIADRERRYEDAIELCEKGVARYPDDYYLLMKRLDQVRTAGDRDAAVRLLARAEAVCPETAATLTSIGYEHAYLGEMEAAESYFRRALIRMPGSSEIREKLAMAMVQQRKMAEGIEELRRAADEDPDNLARRDLLAQTLLAADRFEEVKTLLGAAPDGSLSWEALMCLGVARARIDGADPFAPLPAPPPGAAALPEPPVRSEEKIPSFRVLSAGGEQDIEGAVGDAEPQRA